MESKKELKKKHINTEDRSSVVTWGEEEWRLGKRGEGSQLYGINDS